MTYRIIPERIKICKSALLLSTIFFLYTRIDQTRKDRENFIYLFILYYQSTLHRKRRVWRTGFRSLGILYQDSKQVCSETRRPYYFINLRSYDTHGLWEHKRLIINVNLKTLHRLLRVKVLFHFTFFYILNIMHKPKLKN